MGVVDVRILVEGVSDVEVVSRALKELTLGGEYGITISSIIPTTNSEIAKRAASGADIIIVATDSDGAGNKLAERLMNELKDRAGAVERMKLPLEYSLEHMDVEIVKKEIKNTLVRAGLKALKFIPECSAVKEENRRLKKEIEEMKKKAGYPRPMRIEEVWKRAFPNREPPSEEELGRAIKKLGLEGKVIVGQGYVFSEDLELVERIMAAVYLREVVEE